MVNKTIKKVKTRKGKGKTKDRKIRNNTNKLIGGTSSNASKDQTIFYLQKIILL